MTKWVPILALLGCAHATGGASQATIVPLAAGAAVGWGKPVRIQFSSAPSQTLLVFDDAGHLGVTDESGRVQPVPFSDAVLEGDVVLGGAAPRVCALLRSGRLECVEPDRRLGWSDLPASTGVYAAGSGLCLRTATGPICFALATDGVHTSLVPAPATAPPQPPCNVRAGEATCTGSSRHGELGDGDVIEGQRSARVGLTHVLQAAVGRRHGCAVLMNRRVFCWGVVSDGPELFPLPAEAVTEQLPICDLDEAASQAKLDELTRQRDADIQQCQRKSCEGGERDCAMACDRPLVAKPAVFDHRHPCDEPKEAPLPYVVRPVPLPDLSGVVSLALSGERTCLLLEGGEIRCFGKSD